MKITLELHDPDEILAVANFLRKYRAKPAPEAPAPGKNRRSALDKLSALQSSRDPQDVWTAPEIYPPRGNGSRKLPANSETIDGAS